ncbi:hypothetical protein [Arthrobacter sp. L77]|uniref:hypothetical protein n=1 Tax=Arthrobacter sp. L77 TaxID=1496689 RepID=UPI0006894076|nr:hypothetical protein [Arthrobacter sp. L77]
MEHGPSGNAGRRRLPQALAAAALALTLVTACTGSGGDGGAPPPSTNAATATAGPAEAAVVPLREAREGWKVFTDPGRLLSFELPEEWVVQLLEPEPGVYAPDSLHYAVRTPEGVTAAELHTGIRTAEAPCPDAERTPYHVIGSEPLDLTGEAPASADVEPRVVIRLITGFRFFAAYGITDQVGGADGLACTLSNTVDGGDALGRVSFGDLEVLAPKAPANTGPQTVTFGTIGEAQAFYDTPDFATIREMLLSLRIVPAATG